MPVDRFYHPGPLSGTITLEGSEFQHMAHVCRKKQNEHVECVNGEGTLATGRITEIGKKSADILIEGIEETEKPPSIILAQALPRLNRLDTLLEKATEIGISEFWLFPGERSERRNINDHQETRLAAVCISAMKQCGRLWLPKIKFLPPLAKWEEWPAKFFFGALDQSSPPLLQALKMPSSPAIIFIGPESGFSDEEITQMKAKGGFGVSLGPTILRTDTAAIVASALIAAINF